MQAYSHCWFLVSVGKLSPCHSKMPNLLMGSVLQQATCSVDKFNTKAPKQSFVD